MTALAPQLTHLDQRVLAMLDRPSGVRAAEIARRTCLDASDVRLILRGLEHLDLAMQAGGWWKAT